MDAELDKIWKEVNLLLNKIPKEHKKTVKRIAELYRKIGSSDVLEIVKSLSEINLNDVTSYCVCHDSEIDGG